MTDKDLFGLNQTKKVFNDKHESYFKIVNKLYEIYENKNKDYGDSFSVSIAKHGPIAFVVRASDKMLRLEQLVNNEAKVKDEGFYDTVTDLANYCIMMLMEKDQK